MRLDSSGNLGIGDDSPDYPLEILSTTTQFAITHTDTTAYTEFTVNSSGNLNIRNNNGRIFEEDGSTGGNLFIGEDAFANDSGQYNVGVGYQAGYNNDSSGGGNNGRYNIYMGYKAGYGDGGANNEGYFNVGIGNKALYDNTTGYRNAAIGYLALSSNTTGHYNVAAGSYALALNTGSSNSALGEAALYANTAGSNNSALGTSALYNNTTGIRNSALGYRALYTNTTGQHNTAVGYQAGHNSNGSNNVFFGYRAGYNQTTNSNLLIIDNQDRTSATLEATNSLIYGTFNATPASQTLGFNANVGIYDSSPDAILEITSGGTGNDFFHITSGTTDGDIFTVDSNGNVGIGDSTPDAILEITTSSAGADYFMLSSNADNNGDIMKVDSAGDINFDSGTMFVDASANRVGIGTTSPSQGLDVNGNIEADRLYFSDLNDYDNLYWDSSHRIGKSGGLRIAAGNGLHITGKVGIGDEYMDAHLEVSADGGSGGSAFMVSSDDDNDGDLLIVKEDGNVGIGDTSPDAVLEITSSMGGSDLFMISSTAGGDGDIFTVDSSGNVGIGTTTPGALTHLRKPAVGKSMNPVEMLRLEVSDEGVDLYGSHGPSIDFYIPHGNPTSILGARIAGTRGPSGADNDDYGWLTFSTNDGTALDEIVRFHDSGGVAVGDDYVAEDPGADNMIIEGNVGIGDTSPDYPLEILSTTSPQLALSAIDGSAYGTMGVNSEGYLSINTSGGRVGIGTNNPSYELSIGSTDGSDQIGIYHDNSGAYMKWTDGDLMLITDEGTNTNTRLYIRGKGTGYGALNLYDNDNAEYLSLVARDGSGRIEVAGSSVGALHLNRSANSGVELFANADGNETQELQIYGYRTGDSRRSLEIGVGTDADDTASFDGVSNYYFDGNMGIGTTAPDALLDIASASGKDFFNISDNAHGDIFTVDSGGNVGIGTTTPSGLLSLGHWNKSHIFWSVYLWHRYVYRADEAG